MKSLFVFPLLFTLLEGGMDWVAYKETLFIGEPIILIKRFKNTETRPVRIQRFKASYPRDKFDLIFKADTFRYFPGGSEKYGLSKPDSIFIMPGDSVYSSILLFWKDFGSKERKPSFPKEGEKSKIWINGSDIISLFFIEPPKEEIDVFEAMGDYHESMRPIPHKQEYKTRLLKNFLQKKNHLSPYLYYLQFLWNKLPTKIKAVNEMKSQFPKHILTEKAEIGLMVSLEGESNLKNKKIAQEMRKELVKEYPSDISLRKE